MDNINLYTKLALLPDHLKSEVADFIDFLASKGKKKPERKKPVFGSGKGTFVIKPGFDDPLEDLKNICINAAQFARYTCFYLVHKR